MWGDPDPDPGGSGESRKETQKLSPQELSELKDQNEQQLLLIAQLKEMLRKEQSSVSQEKVEEYVNTLNRNKAKRSFRQKKDGSVAANTSSSSSVGIDASKKERINLLRQQMEENKARLAERGKSQKGIEEMVSQLQAKLKDNQTLISSTPLNVSLVETKNLDYNEDTPQKDLYNILLIKERKITELLNKSQKLEGTILDLQENLKEKDSVIDARTKAITLMTDSLSKKGKSTLDALDETKEQMRKMQEDFVTLEAEMKARQVTLLNDLKMKNFEISDLQQANSQLEKEKLELEKQLSGFERSEVSLVATDNDNVVQLRSELDKLQLDNQHYLEKINELEARSLEETVDHDLQNKFEESCRQNAENMSKISRLELELKEALSKLERFEENKVTEFSKDNIKSLEEEKNKLSEENQKLSSANLENVQRISELEKQLEDALTDLKLLRNTGMGDGIKTSQADNDEITKLKKQLDENNKNMIKMRATQKGKIKELNKRLDQFKKMSDANAFIIQLQNEISKLNEKVAELEDEKGNMQLKMVESTSSSKGDSAELEEQLKDLEEKLSIMSQELEEKTKVIDILELEIISLKAELKQKSEEEVKVTTHVSSEMSSINYEEQIENIESEKKKLIEELDAVKTEKEELLKEMENLIKEKQDMATKLDNYIQENMDLIDKLEKLSAEKVSSAESIEIVEGLTQQEKIELAAYQKHINPEDTLKCSDEDNMDPPAELNESVLQLSEDTVELLQKIEMFTQERKEVMQKMEALKEENNMLSLRIKEIENNRDILEETYEQLQNEKETLATEKQELIEKLEKTQEIEATNKVDDQSVHVLDTKLKELQIKCEALVQENDEHKRTLKDFDSKLQEKYDLETRLREMVASNAALEAKLLSNLDEINTYEVTIAGNKDELTKSSELIHELNSKLVEREKDIEELHTNINDLNNVITELQSKNNNYEHMESELQSLKEALTDQLTQANDYESEMAQNNETMRKLQNELVQMNRRILELENELELKDNEIQKVTKDINNKDEIIKNLQSEIENKDAKLKTVSEGMKDKYLSLQKQLDNNGESLKQQIDDLTTKNKEQLEKMKKIAANLKKKTQAYQQLEDQYKSDREKWESEATEKNYSIQASQEKIRSLENELQSLGHQLNLDSEEKIRMQNELIDFKQKVEILEQNNADQQHLIQELKHKQAKLQEVSLQKELSDSLHEEIDTSFTRNVPEDKIRELEMMLETNESELNHYKERVDKFEDTIRILEEEKIGLNTKIVELVEKLDLTSNSFKEKALLEDQLELRLAEVSANDEALSKKLQEMQKEQEELLKKNQENEELIKKLKIKLKKAHDKVTELKNSQTGLHDLETENQELKNQINVLETNQRHIQNENESLQRRNMSDYEKIEADYQIQLEELLKTKNDLTVENEKLLDKLKELDEKEQELNMELDEYKLRLDQSENSHVEEINRLNEEIKRTKEELEKTYAESQRLSNELKESQDKLQHSLIEVDQLNHKLSNVKDQLADISELQQNLATSASEIIELKDKLDHANEKLEHIVKEYDHFKQELNTSNEKLQASIQENTNLRNENDKLKEEIKLVSSGKSIDKSSIILTEKFDGAFTQPEQQKVFESFFQENINPTHGAIPTFQWPDQQASVDLFDNLNQPPTQIKIVEKDNAGEKSEIEDLKQQLEIALKESAHLRTESDTLKQEIQALQFAKASLEASYESSQKLAGEKWGVPEALVLEEFSPKNIKRSQEAQPEHVPACNVFVETNTNDTFAPSVSGLGHFSPNHTNFSDLIPQSQPFSSVIEDGREALIKKIKALEFLLYNIDKEKEIALEQCTEMVNELTQVIYSQANAPRRDEKSASDLESQIMSQEDINKMSLNKKEFMKTQYTPVNKDSGEKSVPVEESVERRTAYLCFDDAGSTSKPDDLFASLESQVVSNQDIIDAASNTKALQNIEFGRVNRSIGEQLQPVIEPLAQSRNAYLCYTKEDKPQSFEAFEENDDGWGWGPEEARLEEEHISNVENTPQVKSLLLEIQQLKEGIKVLQVERENHLEEIKQLQIKSGKLIKKCKELKAKSDQASSTKKQDDGGFFDLNETIQEELKVQIQQLEKRIREITNELEKEKLEKGNLLKRVDVLTSANEKMIDMKEIQDSEVLRWQRKYQEAVEKLQENEWNSDGFGERNKKSLDETQPSTSGSGNESSRIKELENTIRDLTLDNEELQALLEEQSARRIEAEKNKVSANNQEVSELRSLNENLHRELDEIKIKCSELQSELDVASQEKKRLSEEAAALEKALSENKAKISALEVNLKAVMEDKTGENLRNEILIQKNQLANQEAQLKEKELIIQELQITLEHLNNRKVEVEQIVTKLREELTAEANSLQSSLEKDDEIKVEINFLKAQIDKLNITLAEKDQVIQDLNKFIEKEKVENNMLLDQMKTRLGEKDAELKLITAERDKKDLEYQQVLEDLRNKILEIEEYQRMIASLQEHVKEIEVFSADKSQKAQDNQKLIAELQYKSLEIEEKERLIQELQIKVDESKHLTVDREALSEELKTKIKEVEALSAEKLTREMEIQQLYASLQNKEQEFEARTNSLVNELNENWQVQVDQRGADVAESWKMHLEMVEKDYISEIDKLKSDISELEEKCNILSNENNELRKNVDQEIRNEVDKLSALQQQISSHLQTISTLNLELQEKDKHIEEIQNNLANYISLENELQVLKRDNVEKESKLASANIIIETTQKQFDEKREVVESIVSILEKNASSAIPYEKDFILNEFQRQLGLTVVKDSEISRLTQNVADLEAKLNRLTGESSREMTGLNQIIEDMEKELSVVHEKEAEILRLSTELNNLQFEKHRLQQELEAIKTEKDNLIPEYEKIKNEHVNCQSIVEEYRQKVEDYQNTNLTIQQVLDERNKEINELNQKLSQLKENDGNDSNKQVENLSTAISKAKEDYMILQETLTACQNELEETRRELAQKSEKLDIVTQNLHSYQKYYTDFEEEIRRLKQTLEECHSEYTSREGHYIEVLSNKDIERQTLQTQMEGFMRQSQEFSERLNQEYVIKQELEHKLNERTQLVDEDTKQLEELRQIIEEQVMKIEELKKELFNKSNQYDSLIAEMDVGRQPVTQQPIASTSVNPLDAAQKEKYMDDDLTEPVPRAELDLALYMLHQRDVRCEELTVELTQLLEERDTLQLRLSNAIREKEELRKTLTDTSAVLTTPGDRDNTSSLSKSSAIFLAASGTELAKDPLESEQSLATKLSELKIVGYKKDKTFVDEQEARRFQQLAIMQQHINDASRLPPEAAARLVDASYTLSRDVQSPSKVLLNWLWGKNPPKANDS